MYNLVDICHRLIWDVLRHWTSCNLAGICGNQAAVLMTSSCQYWLIAKLSFSTPRRISRLRLSASPLLPFISYLLKKAEGAVDIIWSSMETFVSCRLIPGTKVLYEMKDLTAVRLLHSPFPFVFPIMQKNIAVQKRVQNKEQFLVMSSYSLCTSGRKKQQQKHAGDLQGVRELQLILRNVILHEAETETCYWCWKSI